MNSTTTTTPTTNGQFLSTFTDVGLTSKKQWILPDKMIHQLRLYSPLLMLFYLYFLIDSFFNMSNKYFVQKVIFLVIVAMFWSDVLGSLFHITFVDNSYIDHEFEINNDGYLVVPVKYGYSSAHHYFPQNWKDIDDDTTVLTVAFLQLIPYCVLLFCSNSPEFRFMTTLVFIFNTFTGVSHKWAHLKHHNEPVPFLYDFLIYIGLFLDPKRHVRHHTIHDYDWALLNGISDPITNLFSYIQCKVFGVCSIELYVDNAKRYCKEMNTDIVKIKFDGDVNGKIKCRMVGTKLQFLEKDESETM